MLAGWFSAGAEIFNQAGWFLMECIRVTSHWFAGWPCAYGYVPAPELFTIGLYYGILLAVCAGWLFKSKWRPAKMAGLVLLSLIWCWHWQRQRATTRLTILPLNGGSAVFCDAPGSRNDLLIDCGNATAVEWVTKPFLRAQGVNRLPCLALTHGDLRQIGGAESLRALLPIEQIATSPARFRSPAYRRIIAGLQTPPGHSRVLSRGDSLAGWTVLHPDGGDPFQQADDAALVLLGNIQGTRILLLSDLGRPGQDALLGRNADLRADILVTGLPDRSEPAGEALLDAIRPKLIVIADSEFPAARRAGAALRERLARRGIPVLYTRNTGAVTISLRQDHWDASTLSGPQLSGASRAGR
jgi:beta-lactamase superfamily II metal-dependent hydrolase